MIPLPAKANQPEGADTGGRKAARRVQNLKANKKYRQTPKGKAATKRYKSGEKGRAAIQRYNRTTGKQAQARYRKTLASRLYKAEWRERNRLHNRLYMQDYRRRTDGDLRCNQ